MRILSVDTCLRAGGVASLNRGAVIASEFSRSGEPYSSRLFNHLAALQAKTGLSPADYDLYAVASGPGSFTGVRVGITAVKAWAELYGKPVIGVSTLQAVAYQSHAVQSLSGHSALLQSQSAQSSGCVCAVIDARRGQVFGGIYGVRAASRELRTHPGEAIALDHLAPATDPAATAVTNSAAPDVVAFETFYEGVSSVPELLAELVNRVGAGSARAAHSDAASNFPVSGDARKDSGRVEFVTPSLEIIRSAVEGGSFNGVRITEASEDLAPWVGRAGYEKYLFGEISDVLQLDANYIRRCDAEVYWKGA